MSVYLATSVIDGICGIGFLISDSRTHRDGNRIRTGIKQADNLRVALEQVSAMAGSIFSLRRAPTDEMMTRIAALNRAMTAVYITIGSPPLYREIRTEASFDISLEGTADAIEAVRETFSPTARHTRKEQLRHITEMNQILEAEKKLDLADRRFNALLANLKKLVESGIITEAEMKENMRAMLSGQVAADEASSALGLVLVASPPQIPPL